MESIAGMVSRQGRKVDANILLGDCILRSFDGGLPAKSWCADDAALATAGTIIDAPPISRGEIVLAAAARIDNRDELNTVLGLPAEAAAPRSDARLVFQAYQRWGDACVDHLVGDWCFAVWHRQQRRLFLARDHYGMTSLYYAVKDDVVYFSSYLNFFLSLPGWSFQPEEEYIAALLTVFPPEKNHTIFKGIHRIPPGHYLVADSGGIALHQYYHLENAPDVRFSRDADYVDAFREIYTEAVACRLAHRRPVGVTLSGGLDSGSVAVTASALLKGEKQPILAFSHVPRYAVDEIGARAKCSPDESAHIQATAAKAGNIAVEWIDSADLSPVSGQARLLDCFPEPIFGAANSFWLYQIVEKARQRQAGVLLTGQAGNATISWNGKGVLAALARNGRWKSLLNEIRASGKVRGVALSRLIASDLCAPLIPRILFRFYLERLRGRRSYDYYSSINSGFAADIKLEELMRRKNHDPYFQPSADTRGMRFRIIHPGVSNIGCFWHEIGLYFQLPVLDPTADKRVMEFCLGIPDDQHLKGGVDRRLVRRAFENDLPEQVLWNRHKGLQAADIVLRLRASAKQVGALIDKLSRSELTRYFLDIPKLRKIYNSIHGPVTPQSTFLCSSELMRGLMMGQCLLRYFD